MAARAGRVLRQQCQRLYCTSSSLVYKPLAARKSLETQEVVLARNCDSIPGLFRSANSLFSQGGALYIQRAGIKAVGEDTDSHDDFRPVHRDSASVPSVHELIEKDIKDNPVMVYMKGVPDAPECGFSSMVCKILDGYGVKYKSRNVLTDQELREGIKTFSNWPTIPQVYVDGEFLGGSDILMSMHRSGELENKLKHLRKGS
ncbi:unnamed protein product [Sphagnum balticum]